VVFAPKRPPDGEAAGAPKVVAGFAPNTLLLAPNVLVAGAAPNVLVVAPPPPNMPLPVAPKPGAWGLAPKVLVDALLLPNPPIR
jgi:hypothetical protein